MGSFAANVAVHASPPNSFSTFAFTASSIWHTDPLPQCQYPMRVIAVIDQRDVIEKILRHLGLWNGVLTLAPARFPPDPDAGPWIREPCDDADPMPDYENILTD